MYRLASVALTVLAPVVDSESTTGMIMCDSVCGRAPVCIELAPTTGANTVSAAEASLYMFESESELVAQLGMAMFSVGKVGAVTADFTIWQALLIRRAARTLGQLAALAFAF